MEPRLSFAARDRTIARAMRRVLPRLQPIFDGIAQVSLSNPIHSAILVGLTDERDSSYFEEVPNDDGFFQVIVGCKPQLHEAQLTRQVFDIIRRAARACPFTPVDQSSIQAVFDRCERDIDTA